VGLPFAPAKPGNEEHRMILAQHDIVNYSVTQSGIGIGSALAVVLSWHRNKSIILAIIHAILSWIYVIYFALTRRPDELR
jgi:hypothetical protein